MENRKFLVIIGMTMFFLLLASCQSSQSTAEATKIISSPVPTETPVIPTPTPPPVPTVTDEAALIPTSPPQAVSIAEGFVPPEGKILLIVGQDADTFDQYEQTVQEIPGGFTEYTSLQNLEGVQTPTDYGSGKLYLDYLAARYPNSAIALGLYVVDYLNSINQGNADGNIGKLLDYLTAYNRPVFLRFGYEFDGNWNHYTPAEYKQAWIYFYDQLQSKGVKNVAMVWQSAAYCDGTYGGNLIEAWYPGDEYVDWVGLSYFTQEDCNFAPVMEVINFARKHQKPVMIAEASPQRYETGKLTYSLNGQEFAPRTAEQIWSEWYQPFFDLIHQNADVIQAVAYINTYWDKQSMWGPPYNNGYWGDARVQANPVILENWKNEINQPVWLQAGPDLFATLGWKLP